MAVERLTAIGWGLVMFGIVIGLGVTVLQRFGDVVVICSDVGAPSWNATAQQCQNLTNGTIGSAGGSAYTGISYVTTQMGSSGLAGWIPVIIVVVIAGLIFAYFGMKGKAY